MGEESRKGKAAEKTVKVKKPKEAVMARGGEALVASKAPGKLATVKKSAAAVKKPTTFMLSAPQATRVFVAGSFNGWDPAATPLRKDKAGLWKRAVTLEPGRYEYRFVVDGVWWDDPMNAVRSSNEFGTQNCVITVE